LADAEGTTAVPITAMEEDATPEPSTTRPQSLSDYQSKPEVELRIPREWPLLGDSPSQTNPPASK